MKTITLRDGSTLGISWHPAEDQPKAAILCLPAMGVRASYYRSFAEQLQQDGYTAITVDHRGHGQSSLRPSCSVDFGYEAMVQDLHEVVQEVRYELPKNTPVFAAGHSLGGQMASLCAARYPDDFDGIILITACLVHYEGWDGWKAQRVKLAGHLFYPLSRLIGYFPGNTIGFGGREARTVMYDWCYNLLYGKYRPAKSDFDYEAGLSRAQLPVLALSLAKDEFAPERAVQNLCDKFANNANVQHLHVSPNGISNDQNPHFYWVKNSSILFPFIQSWIQQVSD